ncbi:hypothetical protein NEOLI_001890 [Neolecta irregularis DAH-3]|uniref:Uncharacterized protein n=1 Tax=Neolecta irregularis (strain DAH-3) TaxID=1198029 RepID=A0A1U7LWH5_NEOID|nr:hypothetical protein NEOLI_001890 [Neolecta irregularis DAH-3]|eukprot:OLL26861.1 hypothetical protein NEOLI_001890 [Neolecta irregularis DAH-3]
MTISDIKLASLGSKVQIEYQKQSDDFSPIHVGQNIRASVFFETLASGYIDGLDVLFEGYCSVGGKNQRILSRVILSTRLRHYHKGFHNEYFEFRIPEESDILVYHSKDQNEYWDIYLQERSRYLLPRSTQVMLGDKLARIWLHNIHYQVASDIKETSSNEALSS